jgi:hypothetical protein
MNDPYGNYKNIVFIYLQDESTGNDEGVRAMDRVMAVPYLWYNDERYLWEESIDNPLGLNGTGNARLDQQTVLEFQDGLLTSHDIIMTV